MSDKITDKMVRRLMTDSGVQPFGTGVFGPAEVYRMFRNAICAIAADPSLLDGVVPGWGKKPTVSELHDALYDQEDDYTFELCFDPLERLVERGYAIDDPTPEAAPLPTVEPLERYMSNLHAYFTVITQDAADGRYPSRTSKAMYEHVEQMIAGLHAAASKGAANG